MANKHIQKLNKLDIALKGNYNRFANPLRTASPSVNSIFGKTWGFANGLFMLLWGPQKAGKSLLARSFVGELHRTDPEALAVWFDTEFRQDAQMSTEEDMTAWGIDPERLSILQTNDPGDVFDTISKTIAEAIQKDGAKFKLLIIDSMSGILGRRESESETIDSQQRGDEALTYQTGMKRILAVCRRNNINLIVTAHCKKEQDLMKVKMGETDRPGVAGGVQHYCEYFVYVERARGKAGRVDELGNEFIDESKKDMTDSAEITGHKIKVWMQDSSVGSKNRTGTFTVDYDKGIINVHEEVFHLGVRWGVITKPSNITYQYGDKKWVGKPAALEELSKSKALRDAIVNDLMALESKKHGIGELTGEEIREEFRGGDSNQP